MFHFERLITPAISTSTDTPGELAKRGNRRRLRVFLAVFLVLALAGLAFTFARPVEYRTSARITIATGRTFAETPVVGQAGNAAISGAPGAADAAALFLEIDILSSRGLIEAALNALRQKGMELSEFAPDPIQGVQSNLAVDTANGSNIVRLSLTGPQPEHLAALLNALVDVYIHRLGETYESASSVENATLREELRDLETRLAAKRRIVEDYRQSSDIVSGEREENQVLTRVRGLSDSLNDANDKLAQIEGRVRSLRESIAAGKSVVRARDDPTLAALEARVSQIRESLREQERTYTPQFMAMDPNVRGMQARLADLERQIAEQRGNSAQTALGEAEEQLAAAQQTRQRLQQQITAERGAVHAFSARFNTFKAMQEELSQLEASQRNVSERLLRTESSEKSRRPSVQVIETAAVPREIWRPDYARDVGLSFGLAFVIGMLAMGFVELFNRVPREVPGPVIVPQPWIAVTSLPQALIPGIVSEALPNERLLPALSAPKLPRELSPAETSELLRAARREDVPFIALLLAGASLREIQAASGSDLDIEREDIHLPGNPGRDLHLPRQLLTLFGAGFQDGTSIVAAAFGTSLTEDEARRRLICVAHDAGIDNPAEVTPDVLRHTCIAYLVRQGLRFGELDHIVGALPADALAAYAELSPPGVRRSIADIDPLLPGLRAGLGI